VRMVGKTGVGVGVGIVGTVGDVVGIVKWEQLARVRSFGDTV
jgi:hypothetical protein